MRANANMKYRRKSGIGFIQLNKVKGVLINNNQNIQTVNEYFSNVLSSYTNRLQKLCDLLHNINHDMQIKVVGGGKVAQIRIVEGCIALYLINVLSSDQTSAEHKEAIVAIYDTIKACAKRDLRRVERKKTGFKGARAVGPTNKR